MNILFRFKGQKYLKSAQPVDSTRLNMWPRDGAKITKYFQGLLLPFKLQTTKNTAIRDRNITAPHLHSNALIHWLLAVYAVNDDIPG